MRKSHLCIYEHGKSAHLSQATVTLHYNGVHSPGSSITRLLAPYRGPWGTPGEPLEALKNIENTVKTLNIILVISKHMFFEKHISCPPLFSFFRAKSPSSPRVPVACRSNPRGMGFLDVTLRQVTADQLDAKKALVSVRTHDSVANALQTMCAHGLSALAVEGATPGDPHALQVGQTSLIGFISVANIVYHIFAKLYACKMGLERAAALYGEPRFQMYFHADQNCEYVRAVSKRSARGSLPALESTVRALHRWRGRED